MIITNSTHYWLALQYERGMSAAVCVARGVDQIAFKICGVAKGVRYPDRRERAAGARFTPPADIDEEIPVEHFQAVAEVIGYIMGLKRNLSGRRL